MKCDESIIDINTILHVRSPFIQRDFLVIFASYLVISAVLDIDV